MVVLNFVVASTSLYSGSALNKPYRPPFKAPFKDITTTNNKEGVSKSSSPIPDIKQISNQEEAKEIESMTSDDVDMDIDNTVDNPKSELDIDCDRPGKCLKPRHLATADSLQLTFTIKYHLYTCQM